MRNMTSAILVYQPNVIPHSGLRQRMFTPTNPLLLETIYNSPGLRYDKVYKDSSFFFFFFLSEAISWVHHDAMKSLCRRERQTLPQFPCIDRIAHSNSAVYQQGAIFADEGTLQGTYDVHRDIWLREFGFKDDDSAKDFTERLWLVIGDQKNASFIRSIRV